MSFQNSQHITFDSSIVTQTSGAGLEFISCIDKTSPNWCVSDSAGGVAANNVIENSAFYDLAADAIRIGMSGPPTDTNANVPQFNTVQNNVVEGYGRVFPSSKGITQGQGHDNLYTHNDVYDGYKGAINVCYCANSDVNPPFTNNNTISFNHVYNLFQGIMNDAGSLYFGVGTPSPPSSGTGNKMLNNKVHDVNDASVMDSDGYGGDGIYADDFTGLVDVENNLVYRVSGNAISFSGPRAGPNQANTVKNNILAFARQSLMNSYDPYSFGTRAAPPDVLYRLQQPVLFRPQRRRHSFYVRGRLHLRRRGLHRRTSSGTATSIGAPTARSPPIPQAFHVQQSLDASGNCGDQEAMDLLHFRRAGRAWGGCAKRGAESGVQQPGLSGGRLLAAQRFARSGIRRVRPEPGRPVESVIMPPAVPATFPTKTFNPATDF